MHADVCTAYILLTFTVFGNTWTQYSLKIQVGVRTWSLIGIQSDIFVIEPRLEAQTRKRSECSKPAWLEIFNIISQIYRNLIRISCFQTFCWVYEIFYPLCPDDCNNQSDSCSVHRPSLLLEVSKPDACERLHPLLTQHICVSAVIPAVIYVPGN